MEGTWGKWRFGVCLLHPLSVLQLILVPTLLPLPWVEWTLHSVLPAIHHSPHSISPILSLTLPSDTGVSPHSRAL